MSRAGGSSGCLGCVWAVAMLFGTGVLVGGLVWTEPQWLQRIVSWRAPSLPPETILVPSPVGDAPGEVWRPEPTVGLWPEMAAAGDYDPATGLTLTTLEGSEVVLPPGAIADRRSVVVTPVTRLPIAMCQGDQLPIGPILDVAVDGQEHWTFERHIEVAVPFRESLLPEGFPEGRPAIAVWEDGHWRELPTRHDLQAGVLRAQVPHASLLGAVWIGTKVVGWVAAGWAVTTSEPVLTTYKLMMEKVDLTYKTKNFAIHYSSPLQPEREPPLDADYHPHTTFQGKRDPVHARYITDLGVFLEEGRSWLPEVHMKVGEAWVDRWDVFVIPLAGAFGATFLGGPLLIDNDMRFGTETGFPQPLEWVMRRTCVHELIHIAQDAYMSNLGVSYHRQKWWMESTADYLSNVLMEAKKGVLDPLPLYYIRTEPALPAVGWDGGHDIAWYAHARFLKWMESYGLDVPKAIFAVNRAGDFTEAGIDRVLRSQPPGRSLQQYHMSFARAFYHDNLWSGEVTGLTAAAEVLPAQVNAFTRLATPVGGTLQLSVYGEASLAEDPVVARLFPFNASRLPGARQARLAVQVEAPPGAVDIHVASSELRGNPVFSGSPSSISMERAQPLVNLVSSERMASTPRAPTDIDWMPVIVSHGSFATGNAPITVRRWLLMAPVHVQFARRDDGRYAVSWHEAELKTAGDGKAFRGYHVYRRRYGDTEFPSSPLNTVPITDESYVDVPPGGGFFEYTVRVRDVAGNLSEPAPLDVGGDPFVGTWEGKLALVEGSLSELAMRKINAELAKAGPGGDVSGVGAATAAIRGSLAGLELFLRIGVPMKAEIRARGGSYGLRVVEVLGRPVAAPDELPLDRLGRYTLGKLPVTPQGSPIILSLSASDEIRRVFEGDLDEPDLGRMRLALKVAFKRVDRTPPTG